MTAAVFLPSLRGEFLNFDDDVNFLENRGYRGLGPENLKFMVTHHFGHYMPVTWLTLGVDYLVWGMNPFGYHLTNLLLHAANAALCFLLFLRLLRRIRPDADPGLLGGTALAGALFFSIHPQRVESVAWITERRDLVSGVFFLLAALAYLRSLEGPGRVKWLALSVAAFAASSLGKAMGMTFPLVLLVLDVWPLRRFEREGAKAVLLEKLPFFAVMLASGALSAWSQSHADAIYSFQDYPLSQRLGQPGFRLSFYLSKTLLPLGLSPLYFYRPAMGAVHVLGALAVLALTAFLALRRRQLPGAAAAWVAFLLLIGPVSGLAQAGPHFAADRYTYLACLPLAALFGGAFLLPAPGLPRKVGAAVAALLLAVLGALSVRQCGVWLNSVALWDQAIRVEPDVYFSRLHRGRALAARGEWALARADYDRALELNPRWFEAWGSRARARLVQGDAEGALSDATSALLLQPGWSEAHGIRGLALARLGRHREAEAEFSNALDRRPQFVEARVGRATARALLGNPQGALADLHEALAFDPQPTLFLRRATIRGMTGDFDGAVADLDEAIRRKPDYGDAYARRGMARLEQNRKAEAAADLERALDLIPRDSPLRGPLREALLRARAP